MSTYKLRAECIPDVYKLMAKLVPKKLAKDYVITPWVSGDIVFPDVEMVFKSELSLEDLRSIIKSIPDGHVMLETIQLEENYTGEREEVLI